MTSLSNANGHNGNGKNGLPPNGNGKPSNGKPGAALKPAPLLVPSPEPEDQPTEAPRQVRKQDLFDQPVVLQQTSLWSRAILWGILGVTTFVVGWAAIARIEEAVPAQGKLEPQGQVQSIQAPVGGVVQEILVEEGQRVKKGDLLIRFDPRAAEAQAQSLKQIRNNLLQENEFYRSQLQDGSASALPATLPAEVLALTQNRAEITAETNLFRAQLLGGSGGLTPEQQARFSANRLESDSRIAAARLEVMQLQGQLRQTQAQLASAQATFAIDQGIMNDIGPLVEQGALARVQFLRQQQEAIKGQAEVNRLTQEMVRLQSAIAQSEAKVINAVAVTRTDLLNRIAENQKQLSNIDSQLNKTLVENEKRIAEINSQLAQADLTLQYQELRAPIDGVIFDLQAKGPGFVATTSEPVLKVVPADSLVAEVFITNQDIGFVREGMHVDVRIDSFPFSEFGDVRGKVVRIGSDALPPDQINQFWRFPAKVQLEAQTLDVEGTKIPLQSGMSISANIITRDRTVLSIFTDLFSRRVEALKNVR